MGVLEKIKLTYSDEIPRITDYYLIMPDFF